MYLFHRTFCGLLTSRKDLCGIMCCSTELSLWAGLPVAVSSVLRLGFPSCMHQMSDGLLPWPLEGLMDVVDTSDAVVALPCACAPSPQNRRDLLFRGSPSLRCTEGDHHCHCEMGAAGQNLRVLCLRCVSACLAKPPSLPRLVPHPLCRTQ